MYIEEKAGVASLEANIGKVYLSKTSKTLKYDGKEFQSLKGLGYKANYYDVKTGEHYWISRCRKDGNDGLYKTTVYVIKIYERNIGLRYGKCRNEKIRFLSHLLESICPAERNRKTKETTLNKTTGADGVKIAVFR